LGKTLPPDIKMTVLDPFPQALMKWFKVLKRVHAVSNEET